jgi:PAS domain S-box-containing protein
MRDVVAQRAQDRLAGQPVPSRYELRVVGRDGVERTLDFSASTIEYQGQRAILGAALDITQRKQMEMALRSSEARHRLLAENASDMISRVDAHGVWWYLSPACEALLGYPPEELVGRPARTLFHPDESDAVDRFHQAIRHDAGVHTLQHRLLHRSGAWRWFETSARAVRDADAGVVVEIVLVSRDIHERRLAEEAARLHQEQLARVARLGIMGEMISGLAHELAQPLSAILYYARGCMSQLESRVWGIPEARTTLERIASQADRAGEFIRRLKAFVRKTEPKRQPADINTIVRNAVAFASSLIHRQNITLHLDLADDLPPIVVDEIQIEQVILNLVRNGVEALSEKPADQREIAVETSRNAVGRVHVRVRDTGPGVDHDLTGRIFDPFFTTKPEGIGIGLSISRSIIDAHEGELHLEPDPRPGAAFSFSLPPAEDSDHAR